MGPYRHDDNHAAAGILSSLQTLTDIPLMQTFTYIAPLPESVACSWVLSAQLFRHIGVLVQVERISDARACSFGPKEVVHTHFFVLILLVILKKTAQGMQLLQAEGSVASSLEIEGPRKPHDSTAAPCAGTGRHVALDK